MNGCRRLLALKIGTVIGKIDSDYVKPHACCNSDSSVLVGMLTVLSDVRKSCKSSC